MRPWRKNFFPTENRWIRIAGSTCAERERGKRPAAVPLCKKATTVRLGLQ
jgi:hypothetical protein